MFSASGNVFLVGTLALLSNCWLCQAFLRPTAWQKPGEHLAPSSAKQPHILFILVDDLGWAEVSWNRKEGELGTAETQTPNAHRLAKRGVILDRHYTHKLCGPTRSAIQSGRAPIHVNVLNTPPIHVNPADPDGGFAGIPRNMTGIASVLGGAGYRTHFVGKWDAGMATPDHTPAGRGYDTSLSFFHHMNDAWTHKAMHCSHPTSLSPRDLWLYDRNGATPYPGVPARETLNAEECSFTVQKPGTGNCAFEDQQFEDRVTALIRSHDASEPLFIFWATRTVHSQLQPPDEELSRFMFIDMDMRRKYNAMVSWIDGAIGRVVTELEAANMYKDTLIVFSSDNGGSMPGGNNFPLKGGKYSNWEGGIRTAAFVSGGFLPPAVRGTKSEGLIAVWDWYATFASLAGADATDHRALAAGLPAHDSIDQWPLLSGMVSVGDGAPRQLMEIGSNSDGDLEPQTGTTVIGGILIPPYKLILGHGNVSALNYATWQGPISPNSTGVGNGKQPDYKHPKFSQVCGRTPETGCLYDVFADPSETTNLAAQEPGLFQHYVMVADNAQQTVYSPDRGTASDEACQSVFDQYDGFWGPFVQ